MTSSRSALTRWPIPELVVGAYSALVQWIVLRPLLGPFNYADELGYVAAARYFGPGYPDVQMQAGFIHTGYGLFLSPLTVVFDEPQAFHRAATTVNGLLLVFAAVLSCRLLTRTFELRPGQATVVGVLFASSTAVMVNSGLIWAESLLIAMFVAFAWLVSAELTRWRVWLLVALAVAFYAVHPRAIVISVPMLVGFLIDGRRRNHLPTAVAAAMTLIVGIIAVRLFHDHVAGRLYAGSAFELGTNTSIELRLRRLFERPSNWVGGLLGAAWYQLAASFGLVLASATWWVRGGFRWVRHTAHPDGSSSDQLAFFVGAATLSGWLLAGTIAGGELVRIDQTVYGRYLDHLGPFALAFGAALVLSKEGSARVWIAGALATPLLGLVVTLWWGSSAFEAGQPYAPINAPFFASMADLIGSSLPVLIGVAIGAVALAAGLFGRRWPVGALVCLVPVLVVVGLQASSEHVRRHSRDTVNLQAMAEAVESSGAQRALLAEPFAFINLYGGQYWADDVQFVLASECPASTSYDVVIAPIDDVRYLDHRIIFTDPRSERQLLEPPVVAPVDASQVVIRFIDFPTAAVSGSIVEAQIEIENLGEGAVAIAAGGARPPSVAYRFIHPDQSSYDTRPVVIDTGALTLEAGERRVLALDVFVGADGEALPEGSYDLVGDLFVNGLGWVNEAGCPAGLPNGSAVEVVLE